MCNLFQTHGSFRKRIILCYIAIIVILYLFYHGESLYMCDLNILGTHIETLVLFFELGYDM
jgi:hypothetical protein